MLFSTYEVRQQSHHHSYFKSIKFCVPSNVYELKKENLKKKIIFQCDLGYFAQQSE